MKTNIEQKYMERKSVKNYNIFVKIIRAFFKDRSDFSWQCK